MSVSTTLLTSTLTARISVRVKLEDAPLYKEGQRTIQPLYVRVAYRRDMPVSSTDVTVNGPRIKKDGKDGMVVAIDVWNWQRLPWLKEIVEQYHPNWNAIVKWTDEP